MKTERYPHRKSSYAMLLDDLTKAAIRREERRERDADRASEAAMTKAMAALELAVRPIQRAEAVAERRRKVTSLMRKAQAAFEAGAITGEDLVRFEARRHQIVESMANRGLI